jgi:hypothetical protein
MGLYAGRGRRYGSRRYGARRRRSAGRELFWSIPLPAVIAAGVSAAVIIAGGVGAGRWLSATVAADANAAPNPNCTLIVPANPLTAQGLATPYQLTATNPADGPCNEANDGQTAFVQGAVFDPAAGTISIYNPLVIDAGTQPAQSPVVPALPQGAVVAVWFGYNGDTLSLAGADQATVGTGGAAASGSPSAAPSSSASGATGAPGAGPSASGSASASGPASAPASPGGTASPSGAGSPSGTASPAVTPVAYVVSGQPAANAANGPAANGSADPLLQQAKCVAGQNIDGQFSAFGQVGACNAVAFFRAANSAVLSGHLAVPNPGTAKDGMPCLTTRSFSLIDQDQSDNVTSQYLVNDAGQTAQLTAANQQAMAGATTLVNGSDNGLLDFFFNPALGCTPWTAPDLANNGARVTALPLDEIQAASWAGRVRNSGPAALVPLNDPMTVDSDGNASRAKTNTYRAIMDMPAVPAGQSPRAYCADMENIQAKRLQQDVNLLIGAPSPATDAGDNLFTFLSARLQGAFDNLNCGSFGVQNQVSTTADGNGVAVAACFTRQAAPVTPGPGNPTAGTTTCPATTASAPASPTASPSPSASPTASASPSASPTASASAPASAPGTGPSSASAGPTASSSAPGTSPVPTGSPIAVATATMPGGGSGAPSPSSAPVAGGAPAGGAPAGGAPAGAGSAPGTVPTAPSALGSGVPATLPARGPSPSTAPTATGIGWPGTGSSGSGWHDSGRTYSAAYWPGLGRNWARPPAPRGVWVRSVFRGFLSGVLTVF